MAIVEKCGKVKDENSGGYRVYSQIFTDFDNSHDWVKVVKSEDTYIYSITNLQSIEHKIKV